MDRKNKQIKEKMVVQSDYTNMCLDFGTIQNCLHQNNLTILIQITQYTFTTRIKT